MIQQSPSRYISKGNAISICNSIVIAALFTIVKIWKQPKDDVDDVNDDDDDVCVCLYVCIPAICNNMDELESIMLSERSQIKKKQNCPRNLTCGI